MIDASQEINIIQVNGKPFVSGLFWKPLRSARSYMAEARELGRKNHMQMVTIRKARTVIQAGFAPKQRQRLRGMYSLAATLAGQLGDDWIGVFEIGADRYAFVAVYKGAVMPGKDTVGNRETIENLLRQTYSLLTSDSEGDLSQSIRITAPADWNFGNESLELVDLLKPKQLKREYRLKPLTFGLTTNELLLIGGGVVLLVGGGIGYKYRLDKTIAAQAKEAMRAAELAKQAERQTAVDQLVRPWELTPSAPITLEACASHLGGTPIALAGWQFVSARCEPGKAIALYARSKGPPVDAFVAAAKEEFGQVPVLLQQGTVASLESKIVLQPAGAESLPSPARQMIVLTSHVQQLEPLATLTVKEVPFTPDPANPEAPIPDWITKTFQIQTVLPPEHFFASLDTAGLRVLLVETTLAPEDGSLHWTIHGELYAK